MPSFSDHFSAAADRYAAFRPTYPQGLYDWLSLQVPASSHAWDCGTGSGQAALAVSRLCQTVIATDPSVAQLRQAPRVPGVHYAAMAAEASGLAAKSIGLVTVAQAVHWFDLPRFYAEVRRVCVEGGVLAVWSYGLLTVGPELDAVIQRFNSGEVGRYWPAERALVDAGLEGMHFPFDELTAPTFTMNAAWTLDQLTGYIGTWSAVSRFKTATGIDPIPSLRNALAEAWGQSSYIRGVAWPLSLRTGRVSTR